MIFSTTIVAKVFLKQSDSGSIDFNLYKTAIYFKGFFTVRIKIKKNY